MRVIDRPPYFALPSDYASPEKLQHNRMAMGVIYRTIYYKSAINNIAIPDITGQVAASEQARMLEDPPTTTGTASPSPSWPAVSQTRR